VRHRKRVGLGFVVFGCFLASLNALLGTMVLLGDVPEQSSLRILAPTGIVLGLMLTGIGNVIWQRARLAQSHRPPDDGVGDRGRAP
jgi:hypothetical protein